MAMQAAGNVDAFMLGMTRYAKEHGHSSVVLATQGVPARPAHAGHTRPLDAPKRPEF